MSQPSRREGTAPSHEVRAEQRRAGALDRAERRRARSLARASSLCWVLSTEFEEMWRQLCRDRGIVAGDLELTRERRIVLALLAESADNGALAWPGADDELVPRSGLCRTAVYEALRWIERTLGMALRPRTTRPSVAALRRLLRELSLLPIEDLDLRASLKLASLNMRAALSLPPSAPKTLGRLYVCASELRAVGGEWADQLDRHVEELRRPHASSTLRGVMRELGACLRDDVPWRRQETGDREAINVGADEAEEGLLARAQALLRRGVETLASAPHAATTHRLSSRVHALERAISAYDAADGLEARRISGRTFAAFVNGSYARTVAAAPLAWAKGLARATEPIDPGASASDRGVAFDRWSLHVLLCATANEHRACWTTDAVLASRAQRSVRSFQRDLEALRRLGIVQVEHCRRGQVLPDGMKVRVRMIAVRRIDMGADRSRRRISSQISG